MAKFEPVFDSTESAILLAMYEEANGFYDSYSLAWKVNEGVNVPSPEAEKAFKGTRDATENLIERGFARGERLKGADGIYFKELKLTPEGERTAISHRKEVERLKKELPKIMKEAEAASAEIIDYEKKNPRQS
jgi:hypothetical protein